MSVKIAYLDSLFLVSSWVSPTCLAKLIEKVNIRATLLLLLPRFYLMYTNIFLICNVANVALLIGSRNYARGNQNRGCFCGFSLIYLCLVDYVNYLHAFAAVAHCRNCFFTLIDFAVQLWNFLTGFHKSVLIRYAIRANWANVEKRNNDMFSFR